MQSATHTQPKTGVIRLERLSAWGPANWAKLALVVLCAGALIGYLAFPTYPTYDSFYALLWGRDLLHLHLPDFRVYRAPTEHPLAIAFGMFCSIFGQAGGRLMVLGSIASFVALVVGMYRLGRLCFGPVVGVLAGLLVLSRFFVENLAAQGYLDISYVALIVWAIVLEVEKPRRGTVVFVLLAAAGLLRPDAWVLSGVYWLWCVWGSSSRSPAVTGRGPVRGGRARARVSAALADRRTFGYLALALIAPVIWVAMDGIVTGDPLYSLHSTAGLAQELERTQGLTSVLASTWTFAVRIDKLPVVLGVLAGIPLALWLAPRRAATPLVAMLVLVGVFVAEGAVGASVVGRYMVGVSVLGLLFCAVAIGGWSMLLPGSTMRRVWLGGAAVLVVYGVLSVATTLSLSSLRTTLAYHEDFHEGLAAALHNPAVQAQLSRCPLVSLPDNKLIPDARWILDTVGQHDIVARSQARADAAKGSDTLEKRIRRGSVAVYPLGSAVFIEAIVDVGDDPRDQVPLTGFRRIYTSRYYAVYGNC